MPQLDIVFDCCITDPPYGVLNRKNKSVLWDNIIPFEKMWNILMQKIKHDGAIVLFGQEPFSSYLRCSNIQNYKYDWIWDKTRKSGFLNANKRPLKQHELIHVFSYGNTPYYPQFIKCELHQKNHNQRNKKTNNCYGKYKSLKIEFTDYKYPSTIINIPKIHHYNLHPTQKPVALIEYLIKTYTLENEYVLDFTAGSGTTGIACMETSRKCVLIEKEEKYCDIIIKRLQDKEKEISERLF